MVGYAKAGEGSHWPRTHLALQPAQLVAQAVVHLHQLLHLGLGGRQSLLHLQVLLQCDGAVREVGGVHALRGEGLSTGIPELGRGPGQGAGAHPGTVVAGGVAQQLLVRVLVRGNAVVVVLVVQVTLAPQRVVKGVWGKAVGC